MKPARLKLLARGAVQGVGFRPFVYRLASELGLAGWVSNSASGVEIEVESVRSRLELFRRRLETEKPRHCVLRAVESAWLEPVGYRGFEIRESEQSESKTTLVLPDIATCPDCLREIFEPGNRRFQYPFTNCTNCGPRFTIIEQLPYDRAHTSMKAFAMCPACQREYDEPNDRRFHAQPNACPVCGPQVELWDSQGHVTHRGTQGLEAAAAAIRDGAIAAVKGLGGFHLMAAAHCDDSVSRLRRLKHRGEKPFALMFPSLARVKIECAVSDLEERLLLSPQAPIVLLQRRDNVPDSQSAIASLVAPGNPSLGVMLPSTPLHHQMMKLLGFPIVATSGNLAEEPICIDEREALRRLGGIADVYLVHNRPIVRHADDSVVRVMAGRELVLRRARGYAPLPAAISRQRQVEQSSGKGGRTDCILAVGAHLKNSIALAVGEEVFISQHIGDLESPEAYTAFERVISDFTAFYQAQPDLVAADAHPDYLSTRFALATGQPVVRVQHHYAHVLSCMAEHGLDDGVLGVSWDGTGLGTDGTIWGGEFLAISPASFERFGHLRTFRLPGGDQAVKEPRRSALGLLYELYGDAAFEMRQLAPVRAFSDAELAALKRMLKQRLNSPVTSSAGRLFDGVAALVGLRQRAAFEGQAAMDLEFAAQGIETEEAYPLALGGALGSAEPARENLQQSRASSKVPAAVGKSHPRISENPRGPLVINWGGMLIQIIEDARKGLPVGLISTKFHNGLVEAIVETARRAGRQNVALSGGCFQNRYLIERAVVRLRQTGFNPYWNHLVPPNDGGIALGQVMAAERGLRSKEN